MPPSDGGGIPPAISYEGFDRWCADPVVARDYLGRPLASYLFTQDAAAQAGLDPPQIPGRIGCALCIFVLQRKQASGILFPSFVLPFEWVAGEPDSPMMPAGVAMVAEQVRSVTDYKGWGLRLAPELGACNLSGVNLEAGSAWVSLAASLHLAVLGGRPAPFVLATGSWSGRIEPVSDIALKVEAAASLSRVSRKKPVLFVPLENEDEAVAAASGRVEIRVFPSGERDWQKALSSYLLELDVPPQVGLFPLEARLAYSNRLHVMADPERRRRYYLENLLDDIAGQAYAAGGYRQVVRVALALSHSYELAIFVIRALRPARALLLVTPESEGYVDRVQEYCRRFTQVEAYRMESGHEADVLAACVRWLGEEHDSEGRAVEVTGGTKLASLILAAAAWRTGADIYYLTHVIDPALNRPKYGTEKLSRLDWLSRAGDYGKAR